MMMQRTSQAVVNIHKLKGYSTFPYIDDFGGAEQSYTSVRTYHSPRAPPRQIDLRARKCEKVTRRLGE